MTQISEATRIGVMSDTHFPETNVSIDSIYKAFETMDAIVHLGDFSQIELLKSLQKIAPVIAVYGNCDEPELKSLLPEKKIIDIQGFTIGLTHGWGPAKNLEKRVSSKFENVDVIMFGHSHVPLAQQVGKILLLNPGSLTLNMNGPGSYMTLEIGKTIQYQHHYLD